jgi:ribosome-associated protein
MKKSSAPVQKTNSSSPRIVVVREVPIELCQFIKFGGLTGSGGEAKQLISEGRVLLNGTVETRKRKKLAAGDQVKVDGHVIVVQLG